MRQPRARSASPKAIRPRSWCSPGRQASTASGPSPRPQPRARPSSRPRRTLGGEVLLGDRGLAALPAVSELAQVGQDDVAQERVDGRHGQQPVEDRLRAWLVERGPARRRARRASRRGPARVRAASVADRVADGERGRLRGSQSLREVLPASGARARRRPASRGAARRLSARVEQPVAALPGAQQLGADPGALAQLADPQDLFVRPSPELYRTWTRP